MQPSQLLLGALVQILILMTTVSYGAPSLDRSPRAVSQLCNVGVPGDSCTNIDGVPACNSDYESIVCEILQNCFLLSSLILHRVEVWHTLVNGDAYLIGVAVFALL